MRAAAALLVLAASSVALAGDSAVVLMYHRFGEDRHPSTSVRLEQLDAHLDHLEENRYTVVPLADLLAAMRSSGTLPDRAVVVTIDDAYRTVYEHAFPRLRDRGMPFTVFVSTDAVDQGLPDFMSWEQVGEMAGHGATFANHGATHSSLAERRAGESDEAWRRRVREDVAAGWKRLSEELEPLPGVFAYPHGEYDAEAADIVAGMGYVAFGQHSGAVGPHSDPRAWPRFPMNEAFAEMGDFKIKVASLPLAVAAVEPWDPLTSELRPRVTVTLADSAARLNQLACFVSSQGQVEVEWTEPGRRFAVRPAEAFAPGRQRVNCTAPSASGRYHWFSHPWLVRPAADGD